MRLFCEPSFIVSLVFQDPQWKRIAAAISDDDRPLTSDFGYAEAVSAIALRVRREQLPLETTTTLIEKLDDFLADWERVPIASADIARATGFVARSDLSLRIADAIHIATAERLGETLVTVDRQQSNAASALGVPVLNPLRSEVTR